MEEKVVNLLIEKNLKLATAESCTGGLISERITRVSGASRVFDCGICSYANEIKTKLLGVSEETLNTVGAVSEETAMQMAYGVRRLAGADIGVSTTGIAGPTGGTPEKPVGTVYVGICTEYENYAVRLNLGGDDILPNSREKIRNLTADAVLKLVFDTIIKHF
ncbi:MAG: CinA family protein [Ruminococcus sp.]|nr:CinA family protein [Ruminococcus sp.]